MGFLHERGEMMSAAKWLCPGRRSAIIKSGWLRLRIPAVAGAIICCALVFAQAANGGRWANGCEPASGNTVPSDPGPPKTPVEAMIAEAMKGRGVAPPPCPVPKDNLRERVHNYLELSGRHPDCAAARPGYGDRGRPGRSIV
jgi:hypothetical protein